MPTFNAYGELMYDRFSDVLIDTTLFEVAFERDALGRITQRVEEVDGVLRVFGYGYDEAGRLAAMTRNGTLEVACTDDANGQPPGAERRRSALHPQRDRPNVESPEPKLPA